MSDGVREHVTDGTPCWCGVTNVRSPHRESTAERPPDVLWESEPGLVLGQARYRITASGALLFSPSSGSGWEIMERNRTPMEEELIRRLLVERAEQQRLDDYNDRTEEAAPIPPSRLYPDPIERRLVFLEKRDSAQIEENNDLKRYIAKLEDELRGRLARLEIAKESLDGRVQELDENLAQQTEKLSLVARQVLKLAGSVPSRGQVDAMWEVLHSNLYYPVASWRDGRKVAGALDVLRQLDGALNKPRQAAAPEAPPADKLSSDAIVLAPPDTPALSWNGANRMIDPDGRVALDLGDYDNLRPEEHAWLSRLADLWCAWGDRGYLRDRLYQARYASPDTWRSENAEPWFRQLRSELLAKPWKEGA